MKFIKDVKTAIDKPNENEKIDAVVELLNTTTWQNYFLRAPHVMRCGCQNGDLPLSPADLKLI